MSQVRSAGGNVAELLRLLPQVDEVLRRSSISKLEGRYSRRLVVEAVRSGLAEVRLEIMNALHTPDSVNEACGGLAQRAEKYLLKKSQASLRPVINATGVILQTNLGRAPLAESAIEHISEVARGYCNLEYDLVTGGRGTREQHTESLLLDVLGARLHIIQPVVRPLRAAVVNNCAAACFLALNTLAEGGEVIVSRGELVEIGGGFRVPDILRKSGAVLREVGTTNRTRVQDYASAINERTRLILRVHRSNFRIEGFTEQPSLEELRELGAKTAVPIFEDQGTGCLADLQDIGLNQATSLLRSVATGIDLIAASGDKLLGGPQCGLLVGAPQIIERMRANPLFRALRVDKLTYAALGATLLEYLTDQDSRVPAIALMRASPESLKQRCEAIVSALGESSAEIVASDAVIGGGTTPGATLASFAVSIKVHGMSEDELAAHLRAQDPPVLSRIQKGCVLLDLRAVFPGQDALLLRAVRKVLSGLSEQEKDA